MKLTKIMQTFTKAQAQLEKYISDKSKESQKITSDISYLVGRNREVSDDRRRAEVLLEKIQDFCPTKES